MRARMWSRSRAVARLAGTRATYPGRLDWRSWPVWTLINAPVESGPRTWTNEDPVASTNLALLSSSCAGDINSIRPWGLATFLFLSWTVIFHSRLRTDRGAVLVSIRAGRFDDDARRWRFTSGEFRPCAGEAQPTRGLGLPSAPTHLNSPCSPNLATPPFPQPRPVRGMMCYLVLPFSAVGL